MRLLDIKNYNLSTGIERKVTKYLWILVALLIFQALVPINDVFAISKDPNIYIHNQIVKTDVVPFIKNEELWFL